MHKSVRAERWGPWIAYNAEVFAVADRTHPAVAPYLPFLGLVDSEAWAFGRQLALKLPDGTRVHDRCMEWLRDGHPDATNMLAEFNAAFDEVHAEHTNLTRYLETQYSWYPRHLIDLESLIPAVDSQE
jgi:hypothetical protein